MSENLTSLSARGGVWHNAFERMTAAASPLGTAESPEIMRKLGEESLFGDAMTAGAVSFYDMLRKRNAGKKVWVCNGTACLCAGTQGDLRAGLLRHFKDEEIGSMCCLGRCHEAGAFQYDGRNFSGIPSAELDRVFEPSGVDVSGHRYAVVSHLDPPLLTAPFPGIDSFYAPVREMFGWSRERLAESLVDSGLRGRGGAGFPLDLKWQACRMAEAAEKYIVCNTDEGDPGSYIDKYLMEHRPHAVLAGMMAAGWFAGAETGIVYIRAEYPESLQSVQDAIDELLLAGLLGKDIQGSGFNFSLKVIKGAGAYICGEETALLNSIEGQRPEVRVRPPYPTNHGLFGKPTIINNVETFANIPLILRRGGRAFAEVGTLASTGSKLLSLDSHFVHPGIHEVAMGTPLEQVMMRAGGFRVPVKALQVGGPLGCVVPVSDTSGLSVDFESFQSAGFQLGHGGVIAIPETFPMIRLLEYLFQFTADESCGKCFPCRIGSVRGRELISRAIDGGLRIDRCLFDDLLETLEETSLCGLGSGLPLPVRNILDHFGEELRPYFTN